MWTRRVDMEIAEPILACWRRSSDAKAFYKGFHTLSPESQRYHRFLADQGMHRLNEDIGAGLHLWKQHDACRYNPIRIYVVNEIDG